jgi:hypothetical protein
MTIGGTRTEPRRTRAARAVLIAGAALATACGESHGPNPPELADEAPRVPLITAGIAARGVDAAASDDADVEAIAPDADAADGAATTSYAGSDPGATLEDDEAGDAGGPAACGLSACPPGAPCPDLIVDADDLQASLVVTTRTFAPTDCAVTEACIDAPGTRRLLRFNTTTANIGTGDLSVGSPTTGVCFQWSPCHMHYHFRGFSEYTLYQPDGTTVAARGHKQSFCFEDVQPYPPQPAPAPAQRFSCTQQGLHVGWEDVYPNDIDCQWIDITGLPAGDYLLRVVINTSGYLPESDSTNDSATVPVTIPPP